MSPRQGFGRRPQGDRAVRRLGMLALASVTIMVLDAQGSLSPFGPVRDVVGTAVGPLESASSAAVRPFQELGGFARTNDSLRAELADLRTENATLRAEAARQPLDKQRLAELEGLTKITSQTGYSLVAARVVAVGPAQTFSRTVTIDAGSSAGITKDMTVLNRDGLVGRVVRTTRTTATVLLIVDRESVVGGRLGSNLEVGFLRGRGSISEQGRLVLDLVDNAVAPSRGDVVVTWGSPGGVPYVAGIPLGRVEAVTASPRDSARQALIAPLVDFSALDVVGVVVPDGTTGDRPVLSSGVLP